MFRHPSLKGAPLIKATVLKWKQKRRGYQKIIPFITGEYNNSGRRDIFACSGINIHAFLTAHHCGKLIDNLIHNDKI